MDFLNTIKEMFLSLFGKSKKDEEAKKIARTIVQEGEEFSKDVTELYNQIIKLLSSVLKDTKKYLKKIPTKEEFITILSYIGDEKIEVSIPLESIDRQVILYILNEFDERVLEKFVGEDWYTKLLEKALEEEEGK